MITISRKRIRGISLIELLVVIAILAVLTGLILTAIQSAREATIHSQSKNNLRQIILGIHQLANEKEETIPDLATSSMKGLTVARSDKALFVRLLPYVHGPRPLRIPNGVEDYLNYVSPHVKVYRNPADPSWDHDPAFINGHGKCSYAFNMLAFDGSMSLTSSVPDATSSTIAFGDKYFAKCSNNETVAQTANNYTHLFDPINNEIYGTRRPTFADRGWMDVMPITDPETKKTVPSAAGNTFQVRPRPEDVDPHILQAPFRAGLTVALFDGSVRTISPSIQESIYWAMITPSAGDFVSLE